MEAEGKIKRISMVMNKPSTISRMVNSSLKRREDPTQILGSRRKDLARAPPLHMGLKTVAAVQGLFRRTGEGGTSSKIPI